MRKYAKRLVVTAMDCGFMLLSWIGSVWLYTYLFKNDATNLMGMVIKSSWFIVLACTLCFTVTGVYKNLWRYSNTGNLIRICAASILACFLEYLFIRLVDNFWTFPPLNGRGLWEYAAFLLQRGYWLFPSMEGRGPFEYIVYVTNQGYWLSPAIGMMSFYLLLTLSGGVRLLPSVMAYVKLYFRMGKNRSAQTNVIVVGAGETASVLISELRRRNGSKRRVVALVDDDRNKHGYVLHGVEVKGDCSHIPMLVKKYDAEEIIIAIPFIDNEKLKNIISLCPMGKCRIKLMKPVDRQMDSLDSSLRDLNIGDLLGREETDLGDNASLEFLKGKVVMVTGGGGSIGSELCRQIMGQKPGGLVVFDISETNTYNLQQEMYIQYRDYAREICCFKIGSVLDSVRLKEIFDKYRPDIIFHAAAYKHVPLMEDCPRLAVVNNVIGTYNVALEAQRVGAKRFVLVSTDKAVNPTNVMGASKRLAERVVKSLNGSGTEYVCVRFGNVLGSNGSVIPVFQKQIEAGGPVTLTHPDIIRYFMTIPEAARLVLEAGAMAKGGEIFILDMGKPVKIIDLAENLIRMAGLIPGVDIQIEVTGLRQGEKLYEELILDKENHSVTANKKIYIASEKDLTPEEGASLVERLKKMAEHPEGLLAAIREMVPEYHPSGAAHE